MRNRRLSLSAIAVIALRRALFAWPASARTQDFEVTGWKAAMIIAVIFLILAALIYFVRRRKATSAAPSFIRQPGLSQAHVFSPVWQLAMGARPTQPEIRKTAKLASPVKTVTITAPLNAAAKLIFSLGPLQGQEFVGGNGLFIGRDSARSDIVVLNPMIS